MTKSEMEEYKEYVSARLSQLSPFMQSYALGDFSETIEIPEEEDEFSELLVGLVLMVDDIKELIRERENTITKLQRTEETLRESEEKHRSLVENAPDIIMNVDGEGTIQFMNRTPPGLALEDVVGKNVLDFTPDEYHDMVQRIHKRVFETGTPQSYETFGRVTGQWYSTHVGGILRDGKTVGLTLIVRNITERKRVEEELLLKNIVFESSIAANSTADNEGIINHVNPAFLKMWGYETKEEAIGNSVASFFVNEEDAIPVIEALNETGRWAGEFLAKKKDGSTFISRGFATVVQNEKGEQIGYQSANLDVTAEKEAEEKLKQTVDELERTNADLERFNRLAVGREMRMIELKRQINELTQELGRESPYDLSFLEEQG